MKMDRFGSGEEIRLDRICQATEMDMSSFTHANFRHMCILSGCDYVSNISGIGIKKAYMLVRKHRDPIKV